MKICVTISPALAESWETSDDGLTWTFNLREGVTFHHGTDFTSKDVVHTFTQILDEEFGSGLRTTLLFVDNVEAVDDYTAQFNLSSPNADFAFLTGATQAKIVPHDRTTDEIREKPSGTGAFKMSEYVAGDHTTLVRNDDYWGGAPALAEVRHDQFGRDIFTRVLVGSRNILLLAISATGLGLFLGISVGLSAGYYGGMIDEVLMRLMDIMLSFPSLLLALLILSTLGSDLINVIIGIGIVFMPRVARVVRRVVLSIKTKEFVDAAKVRGESAFYIMTQEILPNATAPIIVEGSIRVSYAILLAASLGFLGLGVQPPAPDWGLQVSEGRQFILTAPWVVLFPSLAIASLVVGVNLLGDGISQVIETADLKMPVVNASQE